MSGSDLRSRSVRLHAFGGPDVLTIEDAAIPAPGSGQVRVRVRAIGLNRTEVTFRAGQSVPPPSLPSKIGFEAAGEIDAVGPDVTDVVAGDRVALIPAYDLGEYGLYGEVALAPARSLVKVPDGVTFEEAAATWVAFATAWVGLVDLGQLSVGQTVLIPAASSDVGLAAIQIARWLGAKPVALTRTSAKAAALRAEGAAFVIATEARDLVAEVLALTCDKGAELVFDPVAGPRFAELVEATKPGGTLVVYDRLSDAPTVLPVMRLLSNRLSIRGVGLTSTTRDDAKLAAIRSFVGDGLAAGALAPSIARIFPFDAIADAHRCLEAGHQVGKIVVTV